jgi:hypothetical protein
MVSGSPAHAAWSDIVGTRVKTLDMGKTKKLASGASTAWVASSHPDVATYSCCEGDRSQSCCDGDYTSGDCKKNASGYAWSWGLAKDEVSDFTMACYFYNTSLEPSQSLDAFALTCMNGLQWGKDALCVQGRQDYQFDSAGHCNCRKAAELFCASNGADTCPSTTDLVSCAAFNQQAGCPERSPSDDVQCAVQ